jgi:hypothetical protein
MDSDLGVASFKSAGFYCLHGFVTGSLLVHPNLAGGESHLSAGGSGTTFAKPGSAAPKKETHTGVINRAGLLGSLHK